MEKFIVTSLLFSVCYVSAYPAVPHHPHKRQSYARSNSLGAPSQEQYYGQMPYTRNYYGGGNGPPPPQSGFYSASSQYYDYPPSQGGGRFPQYHYRDPLHSAYQHGDPMQREITVRNGQMRQKEYQQRTGQETRDTYDPFYFYVNPVAAPQGNKGSYLEGNQGSALAPPQSAPSMPPSSPQSPSSSLPSPTQVSTSLTSNLSSREHSGGPPRNRRNSLTAPPSRDSYFDNEISGDKYEILTSKPSYPAGSRLQNTYPGPPSQRHHYHQYTSRYSNGAPQPNPYRQPPGNPNTFLNYEQIVGAEPPRYANGQSSQPWSIQIGTKLKVNDDGNKQGSQFYVRDERNSRTRPGHYPPK